MGTFKFVFFFMRIGVLCQFYKCRHKFPNDVSPNPLSHNEASVSSAQPPAASVLQEWNYYSRWGGLWKIHFCRGGGSE